MANSRIPSWTSLTEIVLAHPRAVIGLAAVTCVVSCAFMARNLEFWTSRHDLIDPHSAFHHRWLRYEEDFGDSQDVLILINGPDPTVVCQGVDAVAGQLRAAPEYYANVLDRFQTDRLLEKGLYYLPDRLVEQLAVWSTDTAGALQPPLASLPTLESLARALPSILGTTVGNEAWPDRQEDRQQPTSGPIDRLKASLREQFPDYLLIREGLTAVVAVQLRSAEANSLLPPTTAIDRLHAITERIEHEHPELVIGITGLPILEHAEMSTSQTDMTWASLYTLIGIAGLFWASFGGFRYPCLGLCALLIGMAWTCGYITLTVGHLNILSTAFGVILMGLGIDFAIHYVAGYATIRERQDALLRDTRSCIIQTSARVGRPILAGGLTTAAAFFVTYWAEFRGVAELGVIIGGGILLCVAATLFVLPCLILITDRNIPGNISPHRFLNVNRVMRHVWEWPVPTIAICAVVSAFLATGAPYVEVDHNLLHLQPRGLASVVWERFLIDNTDQSTWFAVSVAEGPAEVVERRKAFEQLASVERVEEVSSLIPPVSREKTINVQTICDQIHLISQTPPVLVPQEAPLSGDADEIDATEIRRVAVATWLWDALSSFDSICCVTPPTLDDLPQSLLTRFVSPSGKQALRVYGRGNLWDTDTLAAFVDQVESVDPAATGHPLQAYYASRQMTRSYLTSAAWAALIVALVLWWDLRQWRDVILAALPTTLGIAQLFGLMYWLNIPINPANIIVLPLVIGIGIDDGIHVLHDRRSWGPNQRELGIATTSGILLTSLTSMIGFGSLITAQHVGLQSLGRVVTLGIACCLVNSTVLLPCLLTWRRLPPIEIVRREEKAKPRP